MHTIFERELLQQLENEIVSLGKCLLATFLEVHVVDSDGSDVMPNNPCMLKIVNHA